MMRTWIRKYSIGDVLKKEDIADMLRFAKKSPDGKANGAKRVIDEEWMDLFLIHGTLDELRMLLTRGGYIYDKDGDFWYPTTMNSASVEYVRRALANVQR